jgi:hypothetical protein
VPDIAFVGLGRMGAPMCAALVRAGYKVTATDARAEREPVAIACGASWQDTPAQAASAAGVLISMLPGAREVRAAMLGETGALTSLAAGTAWIDRDYGQRTGADRDKVIAQWGSVDHAPGVEPPTAVRDRAVRGLTDIGQRSRSGTAVVITMR